MSVISEENHGHGGVFDETIADGCTAHDVLQVNVLCNGVFPFAEGRIYVERLRRLKN